MQLGDPSTTDLSQLAMARWERELAELGGPDELLHLELSSPRLLDLGTAHPSGLAAFLAGRATRLSSMFRAPESLRVALAHARALALAAQRLEEVYGLAGAQLATGLLAWDDAPGGPVLAPVLLRPLRLVPRGAGVELDYDLSPGDVAHLNPALVDLLVRSGVSVDDRPVNDPDHGVAARRALDRFSMSLGQLDARLLDRTLAGVFVDHGAGLMSSLRSGSEHLFSHRTVQALLRRPSDVAAAESGAPAGAGLSWQVTASQPSATGAAARASLLDPAQRQVLAAVEEGGDLRVEAAPGTGVTTTLAAIAESAAARGQSVLVVAPTLPELTSLSENLGQARAVGERARAVAAGQAAHAALHRVHPEWGLSRMQVLSRLGALGVSPTSPAADRGTDAVPPAPLAADTLSRLAGDRTAATRLLAEAAQVGTFTSVATESPWTGAAIADEQAGRDALRVVRELLSIDVPAARKVMTHTSQVAGLPTGLSLTEWTAHIEVLSSVRTTLDLMLPEVYDRVSEEMVVATAPSNWRASHGVTMSLLDRRRWKREASALVRPGMMAADLHSSLKRVRLEKDLWARLGGKGTPTVPPTIDQATRACQRVREGLERLEPLLAGSAVGGDLADLSIDELTDRLQRLDDAGADLTNLPRRAELARELERIGLTGLVEHLRRVAAGPDDVAVALETAWLRGVLAAMPVAQQGRPGQQRSTPAAEPLPAHRVTQSLTTTTAIGLGHLDPTESYDLVVLVGAHRIGLAEAVLAVSRARQSVLIGDPAGPPPLRLDLGEEPAATSRGGARVSVLAGTAGRLRTLTLDRVHRQPAKLAGLSAAMGAPESVTARWSVASVDGQELGFVHVPGGTVAAGEGGETIPAQEVEATVALIAEHVRKLPGESLGVLTVGRGMAQNIAEVLRAALRRSPDLAGWLTSAAPEPFAVSDLAHADHIVRDHVVLALGLARDSHGRFEHRFGALDSDAGAQLLTLGVGRARRRLSVLSSLWPADLDTEQLHTLGGRRVARLLAAADQADPAAGAPAFRENGELDPVLGALVTALRDLGAQVAQASDRQVQPDLAVKSGEKRIAVLWDGDPDHGYRSELGAALTRFGWTVRRLQAERIAQNPTRAAADVLR